MQATLLRKLGHGLGAVVGPSYPEVGNGLLEGTKGEAGNSCWAGGWAGTWSGGGACSQEVKGKFLQLSWRVSSACRQESE